MAFDFLSSFLERDQTLTFLGAVISIFTAFGFYFIQKVFVDRKINADKGNRIVIDKIFEFYINNDEYLDSDRFSAIKYDSFYLICKNNKYLMADCDLIKSVEAKIKSIRPLSSKKKKLIFERIDGLKSSIDFSSLDKNPSRYTIAYSGLPMTLCVVSVLIGSAFLSVTFVEPSLTANPECKWLSNYTVRICYYDR